MPNRLLATGRTVRGRIIVTYDLAYAAGTDAANRRMRAAGRNAWDEEDKSLAIRTMASLLHYDPLTGLDIPPSQSAAPSDTERGR